MELFVSDRFNNSKSSVPCLFPDNTFIIKVRQINVYPLPQQIEQRIQIVINKQMNFCFISRYFSIQTLKSISRIVRPPSLGSRFLILKI